MITFYENVLAFMMRTAASFIHASVSLLFPFLHISILFLTTNEIPVLFLTLPSCNHLLSFQLSLWRFLDSLMLEATHPNDGSYILNESLHCILLPEVTKASSDFKQRSGGRGAESRYFFAYFAAWDLEPQWNHSESSGPGRRFTFSAYYDIIHRYLNNFLYILVSVRILPA